MARYEPEPRKGHAAVGVGETLYVWGGDGGSTTILPRVMERFDVSSQEWKRPQQLSRRCQLPDGLNSMAVTIERENAYFFGGRTDSGSYSNALFEVNFSTLQCRQLSPTDVSSAPKKKSFSGMVYFNEKLVIYGGFSGLNHTDELNVFDLKTGVWSLQSTTGETPCPRSGHTFTKIDHHRAVVFGGWTGSSELNDTYILDMKTWNWTKLTDSPTKPLARNHHAACCISGPLTGQQRPLLLVTGGAPAISSDLAADVWLLDVDRGVWREVLLPAYIKRRHNHSAVAFGDGSTFTVVVVFGGYYEESWLSETTLLLLQLRGSSWQVTRVVKPDELGRPDESLRELMRKLELSPQEELHTQRTVTRGQVPPTTHKDSTSSTHTDGTEVKTSPNIDISEVRMGKRLGQGGFGTVYEAKWKKKLVAAKVCPGNLLENLSREIHILTSLPPHPHVLTFFGVALSSDAVSTYIITELASNGSLFDYLHVKKETPSPDQSLAWAQQIASGMQHLHNNNIVHRDLKSGNVLLALGLLAKVCDFGTARTMAKTAKTSQKGTYRWMAPEVVEDVEANINKMCDVFSYGMVLYEIFDRKIPFAEIPGDAVAGVAVLQGKRPPIPANLPQYLCPLLEACWKRDANQRPQFEDIVLAIQTQSFE